MSPKDFSQPDQKISNSEMDDKKLVQNTSQHIDTKLNNIITKRNLFKVEIEQKQDLVADLEKVDKEPKTLEPTKLKLVLWGTVTGQDNAYAVIEENKNRKQSLYQINDLIQGAKLKTILRDKVVLTFQGKDQLLEIQTDSKKNISKSKTIKKEKIKVGPMPVNELNDQDAPDNLDTMAGQIKFRPYFTNGKPDGLMVYGIRPESIFRKIGLRNGDIIKDINDAPIISKTDVSPLFSKIEDQEDLKISVSRKGNIKELIFTPSFE